MRPVIIAGNWKMYKTKSEAEELVNSILAAIAELGNLPCVVLCPPFTALETVVQLVQARGIEVGAQNIDYHDAGAYTGEISAPMLTHLGVKYVILGHSERRQYFGETNASVNLKLKASLKHHLVPIVCVGETVDEREAGLTDAVVSRQVAAALSDVSATELSSLIIAYEPVWAIGTGAVCEPVEANRVAQLIRGTINNLYHKKDFAEAVPILYGGSVKAATIEEQLAQSDIDGALVGGASLKAEEFVPLIQAGCKKVCLTVPKT
ncbi:MAG: triose-phosphate isomerase [Candidatus Melainabacteria bacterium]|nr:triose-phosphate isomerase [Candidatus Melainabacteria bacterium]